MLTSPSIPFAQLTRAALSLAARIVTRRTFRLRRFVEPLFHPALLSAHLLLTALFWAPCPASADTPCLDKFGHPVYPCPSPTGCKDKYGTPIECPPCPAGQCRDPEGNCVPCNCPHGSCVDSDGHCITCPCPDGQCRDPRGDCVPCNCIPGQCVDLDGVCIPCPCPDGACRDASGNCVTCPGCPAGQCLNPSGNCVPCNCPPGSCVDGLGNCIVCPCPVGQCPDPSGNCVPCNCAPGLCVDSQGNCVPCNCPSGMCVDSQGNCVECCPDGYCRDDNGNCVPCNGCPLGECPGPDGNCIPCPCPPDKCLDSAGNCVTCPCADGRCLDDHGNCVECEAPCSPGATSLTSQNSATAAEGCTNWSNSPKLKNKDFRIWWQDPYEPQNPKQNVTANSVVVCYNPAFTSWSEYGFSTDMEKDEDTFLPTGKLHLDTYWSDRGRFISAVPTLVPSETTRFTLSALWRDDNTAPDGLVDKNTNDGRFSHYVFVYFSCGPILPLNPCDIRERSGTWEITTYYTPTEASLSGEFTSEINVKVNNASQKVRVKPGFAAVVKMEGVGKFAPTNPDAQQPYVGYEPQRDKPTFRPGYYYYVEYPKGACGDRLTSWTSIATDWKHELKYTAQAGFTVPRMPWYGREDQEVCLTSIDVGKAIQNKHIDFYVGELPVSGTGAGAFVPFTWYTSVSRLPFADQEDVSCP